MKKILSFLLLTACASLLGSCNDVSLDKPIYIDEETINNTICPATSIYDIDTKEKLDKFVYNCDSIILTINGSGKIVDSLNAEIGDFVTFYSSITKERFPVCVRIETNESMNKFIDIVNEKYTLFPDFTVISTNEKIIEHIKKTDVLPSLRAALDLTKLDSFDYDEKRMLANEIGANIMMIKQSQISAEKVRRTQNMAKAVWCYSESKTRADVYTSISSGSLGVVTNNINQYNKEFNRFQYYENKVLIRSMMNISHRGDCHKYASNTIEASESAIKGGAEALELDFRLTKDGEIVVMHDSTTAATCTDDLVVGDSTLKDLKQIDVIYGIDGELCEPVKIPTFEEVVSLMDKYPDVILYAETKSKEAEFIKTFANKITKYHLENRIVVINFESMNAEYFTYSEIKKLVPNIWGLDLIFSPITSESSIAFKTTHQMGFDCNVATGAIIEPEYLNYMKNRGFLPAYWTLHDKEDNVTKYIDQGVYAMTNNYPGSFAKLVKNIEITEKIASTDVREIYECNLVHYDGTVEESYATIVASDDNDVIFSTDCALESKTYTYLVRASV